MKGNDAAINMYANLGYESFDNPGDPPEVRLLRRTLSDLEDWTRRTSQAWPRKRPRQKNEAGVIRPRHDSFSYTVDWPFDGLECMVSLIKAERSKSRHGSSESTLLYVLFVGADKIWMLDSSHAKPSITSYTCRKLSRSYMYKLYSNSYCIILALLVRCLPTTTLIAKSLHFFLV